MSNNLHENIYRYVYIHTRARLQYIYNTYISFMYLTRFYVEIFVVLKFVCFDFDLQFRSYFLTVRKTNVYTCIERANYAFRE